MVRVMISYEFYVIPERRIMKEKMYGFWNKEIATRYFEDYKKAVKPLLGKPWVKCLDLRDWHPSNPKVMKILSKHINWAMRNNLKYSANIVELNIPELQMNTILKSGIPVLTYKFFKDEKKALEWLESQGF